MAEEHRKAEYEAVQQCLLEYDPFQHIPNTALKYVAKLIEKSIYNSSVDKAKKKGIPTYWSNKNFVAQYSSIGYTVKINIDQNSSVNKDKPFKMRSYVAKRIYNYVVLRYLKFLLREHKFIDKSYIQPIWLKIKEHLPHILPQSVGELSSNELNPLINKPYVDHIIVRSKQETKAKYSTMYECPSCGEKKTIYYEIQTCSADESGTLFINCLNCPTKWTVYG